MTRPSGRCHVQTPEILSGGTLSETNVSDKTGAAVGPGDNPTNGPLSRVRVRSNGQVLTTNQGVPIADNQSSLSDRAICGATA